MIKKRLFCLFAAMMLTACNYTIGLPSNIESAVIRMPDGTLRNGKIESWRNFGDVAQVKIDNTTYITHFSNVVLISGEDLPAKE